MSGIIRAMTVHSGSRGSGRSVSVATDNDNNDAMDGNEAEDKNEASAMTMLHATTRLQVTCTAMRQRTITMPV
jgi:hypothetical protein